jgi:hypothetical protein
MMKYLTVVALIIICLPGSLFADTFDSSNRQHIAEGWLHAIQVGILVHDVDNLWSGHRKEDGIDYNLEVVFNAELKKMLTGVVRPNLGVSINDRGNTSKLYGGIVWEWNNKAFFFNSGLGVAWHNGERNTSDPEKKRLGSRVLFRIPLEFGITLRGSHRLSIMFDHASNAYLANPNEGLDTLGLRYRFQFN